MNKILDTDKYLGTILISEEFQNWGFSIPLCQYNNLLFIVHRT